MIKDLEYMPTGPGKSTNGDWETWDKHPLPGDPDITFPGP